MAEHTHLYCSRDMMTGDREQFAFKRYWCNCIGRWLEWRSEMLRLLRSAWRDREVNGQLRVSRTLLKEDTWLEEGNAAHLQGKSDPSLSDHRHPSAAMRNMPCRCCITAPLHLAAERWSTLTYGNIALHGDGTVKRYLMRLTP